MKYIYKYGRALAMAYKKAMQPQSMQFTNKFVIYSGDSLHVIEYVDQSNMLDHGEYVPTRMDELSKWAEFDVVQAACDGQ